MTTTPRYIKQRDEYSCGAIGVANALKWAGKRFSYRDEAKSFIKKCKCTPGKGMRAPIGTTIQKLTRGWVTVKRLRYATPHTLEQALREGKAVYIVSRYGGRNESHNWHAWLLIAVSPSGKTFWGVNYLVNSNGGKTVDRISRQKMVWHASTGMTGWVLAKKC